MATLTIRDTGVYIDQYNFSGSMNQASVQLDVELHDATTFGTNGTRAMTGGLVKNMLDMKGFVDFAEINAGDGDSVDLKFFTDIGIDTPIGTIAVAPLEGERAFLAEWVHANYTPGAEVGALLEFTVKAEGRSRLTRGMVLNNALVARTASGASTAKSQVGAIAADQQGVAHIHVVAFDGTSLDVVLRSDANGAAGGETTRATFAQLTDTGKQRLVVAAPITDAFWDISWTFVGTSVTFLVAFGVEDLSL